MAVPDEFDGKNSRRMTGPARVAPTWELIVSGSLIERGAEAPDFSWTGADGTTRTFSTARAGAPAFLFFHPLAFSHVCRDDFRQLEAAHASWTESHQLFSISMDGEGQGRTFFDELNVTHIEPVDDATLAIARSYGVVRKEGLAERATVHVGSNGLVRHVTIHDFCFPRPIALLDEWLKEAS